MIIGFDGSRAFVERRTGTEEYSFQLLRHLAEIDKENQYIVYLRPVVGSQFTVHSKDWPANFQFKLINFSRLWTQVGLAWHTFTDDLDVLFVPAHTLPLVRRPGLKTVMTVHDLGAEYLPGLHQLKQALYLKAITKLQLKSSSHLIAVSQATKQDLVSKVGVDPRKVTVVYEGYDRVKGQGSRVKQEEILETFGLKAQQYFLFIGTIQPRKNLERLIQAFGLVVTRVKGQGSSKKQLPSLTLDSSDLKLVLTGGQGWKSERIYEQPQILDISDQVLFTGFVSSEKKQVLLKNALAIVFPSLFEGFGLPILEAFAADCPVLTSNISSMPEVAGEAAVLVDPLSVESIGDGMIEMQDEKLRARLVRAGEIQLKKFSWEKAAEETLDLLKKITDK